MYPPDQCPKNFVPSGQGGIMHLNHEYRTSKRRMKYVNSDRYYVGKFYYCIFCLKELPIEGGYVRDDS